MADADVLVCGYGPVGALLTARLAAQGLSVLVVDRSAAPHPLPRAVAADGEVLALLERAAPGSTAGFVRDPPVRFLGRDRREVFRLRLPAPGLALFRQPVLERRLRACAEASAGVEVRDGWLEGFAQDRLGVTAVVDGRPVRCRWLVGCDGAGSTVRATAGMGWWGRDLPTPWTVCDVDGGAADRAAVTYTGDARRPQVDMPVPGGHRWEWAGEVADPLRLVRRDTAAQVRVVRAVCYRLGARRAGRWRQGRVLLAGDAAHTMPPFAGQGLGAGLRDAWALAALLAADRVEAYEPLRVPHVRRMTALSLLLGALVQAGPASGARDALLRGAFATPGLGPWLHRGGPRPEASGVLDL